MDSARPQLAAFELHLRELELPESPADTADFSGPLVDRRDDALAGELDQLLLDSAALTEGLVRLPGAPDCRVIPLFDASSWPIPIPEPELVAEVSEAPPVPELAAPWEIQESRPAVVALIPRADPLRTAIAAAITLPLLLTATPALASAEPEVQRPQTSQPSAQPDQPSAPPEIVEPAAPTLPAAAPPAQPEPPLEAVEADPPTPPESIAPPEPTGDFDVDATPAPATQGVPETLWQAMKGLEVKLMLPSGSRRGRLASVDGPEVVFVDFEGGGRLYSIPKVQVMELRGIVSSSGGRVSGRPYGVPDPNLPSGTGLLAGGIVATSIGTPFFLSAVGIGIACVSCTSITLPLLVPAVLGLGAGIPMIVVGTRRKRAWNRSKIETARLSPSFGRTRHGSWTGSVSFRF